jgi:hypothetical protein
MKNFIWGTLIILTIFGVGVGAYFFGKKISDTTSQITPTITQTEVIDNNSANENMVGNDRDEHGCIGSAGYSWCVSKNKCLRVWEEGCPTSEDPQLIKESLFKKNNWKESDDINVTVSTNDGNYASGIVTSQGGGGYFYAAKENGEWVIVADGNGLIMCSSLINYPKYPTSLIPECYDQTTEKSIKR